MSASPDKCWRCGGEPHEFIDRKPRRPVCSVCAMQLIQTALHEHEGSDARLSLRDALDPRKVPLPYVKGSSLSSPRFCANCQPLDERDGQAMKRCEWRDDTGMEPAWLCAECYADWKARPE